MTQTLTAEPELNAADRCDRCGAQAQARVTFVAGSLLFCQHHFTQHAEALARAVHIPRAL